MNNQPKEKRPFYKNGFIVAIALFILAMIVASKDSRIGSSLGGISFTIFAFTIVHRIFRRLKPKHTEHSKPAPSPANATSVTASSNLSVSVKVAPKSDRKVETYKVAGTSHYKDEIESLGKPNPDFELTKKELREDFEDERVYEYFFPSYNVRLVSEPDNPYDENAVRVEVNHTLIGYIAQGRAKHVKKLLHDDLIEDMDIEIYGGKYKKVDSDGDYTRDETNYGAKLTIEVKKPDE